MEKRKVKMTYTFENEPKYNELDCRRIRVDDLVKVAHTMVDAYKDTVDYEGESHDDALLELRNVVNGGYGSYIDEASFLIEQGNEVVSVILISLFNVKPLVTYVFTAKKHMCKGHAASLLWTSINVLQKMGYNEIFLYVTEGNDSAINLYRKLGFVVVE